MKTILLVIAILFSFGYYLYNRQVAITIQTSTKEVKEIKAYDRLLKTNETIVKSEILREYKTIASCTYAGMCFGCGMNYSGNMDCHFGFHATCSGSQTVIKQEIAEDFFKVYTIENNPKEIYQSPNEKRHYNKISKVLSNCEG